VLTGINLKEVGALIIPTAAVRKLAGLGSDAPLQQVLQSTPVAAHFQKVVNDLALSATGSANRIARLHVMIDPPSIDKGEVTDKGSVNQRAVLTHRAALVEALHADAVQPIFKPHSI
jgi:feruloyl-CoA synthase